MPYNFEWITKGCVAGIGRPGCGLELAGEICPTSVGSSRLETDLSFLRDQEIQTLVSLTESPRDDEVLNAMAF